MSFFGLNKVSTSSAQALLRKDDGWNGKVFIGGLGNSQFGFYMINNSEKHEMVFFIVQPVMDIFDSSGNLPQRHGKYLQHNYNNQIRVTH